jgi:isopentenyldiphosphate isomerase
MGKEYFDIIDKSGNIIGKATREECHGNRSLAHRVVHVLVFNSTGDLFLQKRSRDKDIQPGKWDTSIGGHLDLGETFDQAVRREMKEELGISAPVRHIYDYWMYSDVETEYVRTYLCTYDGVVNLNTNEIENGRFWSREEIEEKIGTGIFTPNFEQEYRKYLKWLDS